MKPGLRVLAVTVFCVLVEHDEVAEQSHRRARGFRKRASPKSPGETVVGPAADRGEQRPQIGALWSRAPIVNILFETRPPSG